MNIPQFKYSKTILERYYIASFNKTLSFQKLLHIDSKCHWQLIQSCAQTRLSMCCWQENNNYCVISCSLAVSKRQTEKKLPKTSATISFFRKEDSLIVNNWKLSIEKHTVVEDKLLLCSSPWNHTIEGSIENSPPGPFSHNFVLLLSNAVTQNVHRILASAMWKLSKISVYL